MPMNQYLLGLDVGTTSIKAALFQTDGRLVAVQNENYTLLTPRPDYVELPPQTYWETLCKLVRRLLGAAKAEANEVLSLAISSQGETLVCLDAQGQPTRDAIVWMDNRSEREAAQLRVRFDKRTVYEKTGQSEIAATWTATKIAWLRNHQPEIFEKTRYFLLLESYLLYRLTGRYVCEPNLLCSSLLYDIQNHCWWSELLEELGIGEVRLPEVLPCGKAVGTLQREAADQLGLSDQTLVCMGAMDQTCGVLGAAGISPGSVTEATGSCIAVCANLEEFLPYEEGRPVTCQNHVLPGRYMVLLSTQTAGMVLKWFAKNFYPAEAKEFSNPFQRIDQEAEQIAPGCDGLLMLPHLSGAGNPEYNPAARGVFYGITMAHGRPHFARAILEAVSFMLRRNLEQLESLGISFQTLSSMGGGAQSPLWCSIKADVTGKTIQAVGNPEAACWGAALLAGHGCGVFPDLEQAARQSLSTGRSYTPNPQNAAVYQDAYQMYLRLYDALYPLFSK